MLFLSRADTPQLRSAHWVWCDDVCAIAYEALGSQRIGDTIIYAYGSSEVWGDTSSDVDGTACG